MFTMFYETYFCSISHLENFTNLSNFLSPNVFMQCIRQSFPPYSSFKLNQQYYCKFFSCKGFVLPYSYCFLIVVEKFHCFTSSLNKEKHSRLPACTSFHSIQIQIFVKTLAVAKQSGKNPNVFHREWKVICGTFFYFMRRLDIRLSYEMDTPLTHKY